MSPTDVEHAQDTRPRSLVFQLLGTAHSVTDRLAEALTELRLSPAGLDLLTQLAEASEPVPVARLRGQAGSGDPRELVVMLERDGLVRSVTNGASHAPVTLALTSLGATRQRAGAERFDAACRQLAGGLGDLDSAAFERALSALR